MVPMPMVHQSIRYKIGYYHGQHRFWRLIWQRQGRRTERRRDASLGNLKCCHLRSVTKMVSDNLSTRTNFDTVRRNP